MSEVIHQMDPLPELESNLSLWDSLHTTDTRYTKRMESGARLTSINPEYQIRKFTEAFGPCGYNWGFRIVESVIVDGADMVKRDIKDDAGNPINFGPSKINTVRLELWYINGGKECVIPATGHTDFVYMSKYGPITDGDYEKKSITDALTKAMSMLGMGGDVRMGQFDNSSYVEELQRQEFIESATDKQAAELEQRKEFEDWLETTVGLMSSAGSMHELEVIYKTGLVRVTAQGAAAQKQIFEDAKNERGRDLVKQQRDKS